MADSQTARSWSLIGNDDIEGCGAGGGVQGLALAWDAQSEWRDVPGGEELRVHLLFNRAVRGPAEAAVTSGAPIAAQVWSWLPYEGSAVVGLEPKGARVPLYTHRAALQEDSTPLYPPRYPR